MFLPAAADSSLPPSIKRQSFSEASHAIDMEANMRPTEARASLNLDHEYSVPSTIKFAWLGAYFLLSLLLTIYNKAVLGVFNLPWLLTFLHSSTSALGTYTMWRMGHFKLSHLGRRENVALAAFSFLFTANIALSNLSLAMVSVPLYQTMRMLCPIFAVFIFRIWYGRTYSMLTYASLAPLIIGAAMTTLGEMKFSDAGFLLTILGVIFAALKTVVTNRFMTGSLALQPIEIVFRMSPLAAVQALIWAVATGEIDRFLHGFGHTVIISKTAFFVTFVTLFGNGCLAFLLNISSFSSNKLAGALTMTVCGNLKQCLTVLLGILIFHIEVSFVKGAGMVITMLGAAVYSKAELDNKRLKLVSRRNAF